MPAAHCGQVRFAASGHAAVITGTERWELLTALALKQMRQLAHTGSALAIASRCNLLPASVDGSLLAQLIGAVRVQMIGERDLRRDRRRASCWRRSCAQAEARRREQKDADGCEPCLHTRGDRDCESSHSHWKRMDFGSFFEGSFLWLPESNSLGWLSAHCASASTHTLMADARRWQRMFSLCRVQLRHMHGHGSATYAHACAA